MLMILAVSTYNVNIIMSNKNITKYSLKAVKCNDQLRKSLTELSEIIDYIEYDRKYIELFFQLKKFQQKKMIMNLLPCLASR